MNTKRINSSKLALKEGLIEVTEPISDPVVQKSVQLEKPVYEGDPISEEVTNLFEEVEIQRDYSLEHTSSGRQNILATTGNEDHSPVVGEERNLIGNITGFPSGGIGFSTIKK